MTLSRFSNISLLVGAVTVVIMLTAKLVFQLGIYPFVFWIGFLAFVIGFVIKIATGILRRKS